MRAVDDYVKSLHDNYMESLQSLHEPDQMPLWITIGEIAEALGMFDTRAGLESYAGR